MTTDEAAEKWLAIYDEVQPLIRTHEFDEACALLTRRRDDAAAESDNELAASLSTLLATCLTMTGRDGEALIAAEAAETIDPSSMDAKLSLGRILLNFAGDPERARAKAEQVLAILPADDPFRYGALALFGTATARCGDIDGALRVFREMTTPASLGGLRRADYVGAYDLQVVTELVRAGVAKEECRRYLETVKSAPSPWRHRQRELDELLAAVEDV